MAIDSGLRAQLVLPAVCAPMFLVSNPVLTREACLAGIIGALPRANARSLDIFEGWLAEVIAARAAKLAANPAARIGPLAVNLLTRLPEEELDHEIEVCRRHGVEIFISATGNPALVTQRVHAQGGKLFHDVTSFKFARKAIDAGVDGLTCIGAGGGGHSGTINHLALIPRIRQIFDGTLLMAGGISTGAAIRAAEVLGADLAYMGTRFIATQESGVDPAYHQLLVESTSADLLYTGAISGVPANWMVKSMEALGLDPAHLPQPAGKGHGTGHLPEGVQPWKNLWSAGQGVDLIADIPTVADLVARLRREYVAACDMASMADVARLADEAEQAARSAEY